MGRGGRRGPYQPQQAAVSTAQIVQGLQASKQDPATTTTIMSDFMSKVPDVHLSSGWIEVKFQKEVEHGGQLEIHIGRIPMTEKNPVDYILNKWGPRYGSGDYLIRPLTAEGHDIPGAPFKSIHIEVPESLMVGPKIQATVVPDDPELARERRELELLDIRKDKARKQKELKKEQGDEDDASSSTKWTSPYGAYGPYGAGGMGMGMGVYDWWRQQQQPQQQAPAQPDPALTSLAEELKKARYEIEDTRKAMADSLAKQETERREREYKDIIARHEREIAELRAGGGPAAKESAAVAELRAEFRGVIDRLTPRPEVTLAQDIKAAIAELGTKIASGQQQGQSGDTVQALVLKAFMDNSASTRNSEAMMKIVTDAASSKSSGEAQMMDRFMALFNQLNRREDPSAMAQMASVVTNLIGSTMQSSTQQAKDQLEFLNALKRNMDPTQNKPWSEIVMGALQDYYQMVNKGDEIRGNIAEKALAHGADPNKVVQYISGVKPQGQLPAASPPVQQQPQALPTGHSAPAAAAPQPQEPEGSSMIDRLLKKFPAESSLIFSMIAQAVREGIHPIQTADQLAATLHLAQGDSLPTLTQVVIGWIPFLKYSRLKAVLPTLDIDDEDKATLTSEAAIVWWRKFQDVIKDPDAARAAVKVQGEGQPAPSTSAPEVDPSAGSVGQGSPSGDTASPEANVVAPASAGTAGA